MNIVGVISYYENSKLLFKAIDSLVNQVDELIIVNSGKEDLTTDYSNVKFLRPTTRLLGFQVINYTVEESIREGRDYAFCMHNDIVASEDSVKRLFDKFNEVKDEKWGKIFGCYDTFCLLNPKFFRDEDIWFDPLLFPCYFGDNHLYRIMNLLGYKEYSVDCDVSHYGSNTIKLNPIHGRQNSITFRHYDEIYAEIWGGRAGQEKVVDVYSTGLVRKKV